MRRVSRPTNVLLQVQTCKIKRAAKDKILREAIAASDRLKLKLEDEFKDNQKITANLVGSETKINGLRSKLSKVDPMDNKSIKLIYDEAVNIKKSLTPELNSVRAEFKTFSCWNLFYFLGENTRTGAIDQKFNSSDQF